ncbi:hypothetical protein ACHAXA_009070 [Cyclostephanos tholiformis]|jgi:hypothetical protein|uniref:Uncharacterized protein n=1 Tax=Cyclostephanos tholiformis TaxID=382380 RepID=A0ABD3SPV7_9STRA
MSTLRHKKKDHVSTETVSMEDIEALISPDDKDASAPAIQSKSSTAEHDPALLAKLVLSKVGALISSDEGEDDGIATSGGFIAILRDILIGMVFGMLCISILITLDHRDVIHLQSAHDYRTMAFNLLKDPETRKSVQEASGLVFVDVDDHKRKVTEISKFPNMMKEMEEKKKKIAADLEVAKKEHDAIKPGYDVLVLDPSLGLDKFCGDCKWQGGTNCNARKDYLKSTYNLGEIKAKVEMMKSLPQCVNK